MAGDADHPIGADNARHANRCAAAHENAASRFRQCIKRGFVGHADVAGTGQLQSATDHGTVLRVPYIRHLDDHPDVIAVLKEADERRISTFGGTWHSDFSFLPEPPFASMLHALEVPPYGGDTIFASQTLAYERCSPALQAMK